MISNLYYCYDYKSKYSFYLRCVIDNHIITIGCHRLTLNSYKIENLDNHKQKKYIKVPLNRIKKLIIEHNKPLDAYELFFLMYIEKIIKDIKMCIKNIDFGIKFSFACSNRIINRNGKEIERNKRNELNYIKYQLIKLKKQIKECNFSENLCI